MWLSNYRSSLFLTELYAVFYMCIAAPSTEQSELYIEPCEALKEEACTGLGYESALVPSLLSHKSQDLASAELLTFLPLLGVSQVECSELLREFLCALYMPVCTHSGLHLPPCRSLCKQALEGCTSLMEQLDMTWPHKFDCTRFPEHHELMCLMSLNQSSPHIPQSDPLPLIATPNTLLPQDEGWEEEEEEEEEGPRLTQCISNAECVFERSVCRSGECVCEYPRTWGPTGCEDTQILGGICSTDSQCSVVTPQAVCIESVCTCIHPYTSYQNLACIHGSVVGGVCYNDAQCRAVNKFSFCRFLVAGVVGTCTCDPDQFIDSRGKCVPRLGGRCHKGDCPRQLGSASCQRGRDGQPKCFCRKQAIQRRGVCIMQ